MCMRSTLRTMDGDWSKASHLHQHDSPGLSTNAQTAVYVSKRIMASIAESGRYGDATAHGYSRSGQLDTGPGEFSATQWVDSSV